MNITGNTILITGGTSGIGLAFAERFFAEGNTVIICGRRADRLATIAEKNEGMITRVCDIANATDRVALRDWVVQHYPTINVLINNAGLALGLDPAHQADLDEWDRMIDTNIKGLINMTKFILPGMISRSKGHIFNVGSVAGTYPYPGGNVYGASKAFVHEYTSDLRLSLADTPLRVTSIEPGMVSGTEFSNVRLGDDDRASKVYEGIHAMSADDIAESIYWAATLPPHVNINRLELMPVQQSFGSPAFSRITSK